MIRIVLLTALVGCAADPAPAQDPRCPTHWTWSPSNIGNCSPPSGYAALLYAQFGGSGVYGFARLTDRTGISLIPDMEIDLYNPDDVTGTTIQPGAVPIVSPVTSAGGVYKSAIGAGMYTVAVHDPDLGVVVTGDVVVKPDTLALFAIDLDHTGL